MKYETNLIQFIKFGSPYIQQLYRAVCKYRGIDFDDFKNQIIETSGKTYDELKEYWINGERITGVDPEDLFSVDIDNVIIIHFDNDLYQFMCIVIEDGLTCLSDNEKYFEILLSEEPASHQKRRFKVNN